MTTDNDEPRPIDGGEPSTTEKPENPYGGGYKGFKKGNPGRPPGTRTKLHTLSQKLMADDAKAVVESVINAAKAGDMVAAKLVVDRIHPRPRDLTITIDLPPCPLVADVPVVTQLIMDAVAQGEISPSEGSSICNGVLAAHQKALETVQLEQRLAAVEAKLADKVDEQ